MIVSAAVALGACATASQGASGDAPPPDGALGDAIGSDAGPDAVPDAAIDPMCASRPTGWSTLEAGFNVDSDPQSDAGSVMVLARHSGAIAFAVAEGTSIAVRELTSTWGTLGGVIDVNVGQTPSYAGYLAESVTGELYLSAVEWGGSDGTGVYAFALQAGEWSPLGGEISTAGASVQEAPLVIYDGHPSIFWSQYYDADTIGRSQINGRRWNGTSWVTLDPPLGQIAGPGASAISPQATVSPTGRIYLVFAESQSHIRYRDPADTAWRTMGSGQLGMQAFDPLVALGGDGSVYVAYSQYDAADGESNAYVARYGNGSFEQLVKINHAAGHANIKGLAVRDTRVVVAWIEGPEGARKVYAGEVGGSGVSLYGTGRGTAPGDTSLAVDACGDVVLAYTDGVAGARSVRVERFH